MQNENTYCFLSIKGLLTKSYQRKAAKAAIFLPLSCVSGVENKRTFQVTVLHLKREKKSAATFICVFSRSDGKLTPRAKQGSSSCLSLEPWVVWSSTKYDIKRSKYASSVKFGVFQNTCLISSAWCLPALALAFSLLCAQQKWLFHLRDSCKRLNLQTLSPNLTRRLLGTNLSRFLAASIAPLCPAGKGEVELLASFF